MPIKVYRVLPKSGAWSRLEVTATIGLPLLVGRDQEVGLLSGCWVQARGGMGHVVLVSDEGGIGKSRLLQKLQEGMANDGYTHMTFRCAPYYTHSAFYPEVDHIERLLEFSRGDSAKAKLDKLERVLAGYE